MRRLQSTILMAVTVAAGSLMAQPRVEEARGTSTWYTAFSTKEAADKLLADYERAGMNTIYAQVFWKEPFYPTDLGFF